MLHFKVDTKRCGRIRSCFNYGIHTIRKLLLPLKCRFPAFLVRRSGDAEQKEAMFLVAKFLWWRSDQVVQTRQIVDGVGRYSLQSQCIEPFDRKTRAAFARIGLERIAQQVEVNALAATTKEEQGDCLSAYGRGEDRQMGNRSMALGLWSMIEEMLQSQLTRATPNDPSSATRHAETHK